MEKKIVAPKKRHMKQCRADIIFDVVNYTLLSLLLIICLYPLIFVVSASITKPSEVLNGTMWLFPTSIYLDGYAEIFKYKDLWTGYLNAIIISVAGTVLSVVVTFAAGYALSRKDFFAKKFFMVIFVFTMFFGGGLIPTYLLIADTLNLYDSLWALIIPSAVSVWNIILIRTYYVSSISSDLLEAAKLDGCGNIRFFLSIALPLSGPILAVIILYNIVGRWNAYFDALIYISTPSKYPLQLVIRNLLTANEITNLDPNAGVIEIENMMRVEGMKYGVIIISTLPMLVIYPFVQKYFVKGIFVGSLKG
mgnify:FL=1